MPYDKDQKLSPEKSPENREGQGGNKPENRPQCCWEDLPALVFLRSNRGLKTGSAGILRR